jgi:hypothetical protein
MRITVGSMLQAALTIQTYLSMQLLRRSTDTRELCDFATGYNGSIFYRAPGDTFKFVRQDDELANLVDAYNYIVYGKAWIV